MTCVLVTGAGSGPAGNLVASLRAGGGGLRIVGCHHDRFALAQSTADRSYLVPRPDDRGYVEALARVAGAEGVDLAIPTSDDAVAALARARDRLPCRVFLPREATIALCQDKHDLALALEARGVPVPQTLPVRRLEDVDAVFAQIPSRPLWCRARRGSGSVGAAPMATAEQARAWIAYWAAMRGVPADAFLLSEYLPGRDFGCQSLWLDGRLVLLKAFERLAYVTTGASPSGVSSVAALARTVDEPGVAAVAEAAVRAVDGAATGIFGVDLKEDAEGRPRVTEINAGRFLAGTPLLDLTGKHNMALTYVRLGLGEPVDFGSPRDVAEGYYMVRDVDLLPKVFHADEVFDTIHDARA